MNRPSLESIYMDLAKTLAKRSTCSRLHVGAVITSRDMQQVYAIGYNGGARGQANECESLLPGQCGHLHAEINALIKCTMKDPTKVLFVTTSPCSVCAKAIVNSGFSMMYYAEAYRDTAPLAILRAAGIQCALLKEEI